MERISRYLFATCSLSASMLENELVGTLQFVFAFGELDRTCSLSCLSWVRLNHRTDPVHSG